MSVLWPAVAVAQEPAVEPDQEVEPQRVECADAPAVFELLCLSYETLKVNYVDDVADVEWAEAAAHGVREAELAPRGDEPPPPCALPTPAFEQVCGEIDAVADTAAAVWAASDAMFASRGDPNNYLMTPGQHGNFGSRLSGGSSYVGIGLSLGLLDGSGPCQELSERCRLAVAEVFAGGPAERAGLRAEDLIVSLGGFMPSGSGCGIDDLPAFELGAVARVEVERDGEPLTFMVEVAEVTVPNVAGQVMAGIGHLRIGSFAEGTESQVSRALQSLLDDGIWSLAIDLRGNPGGYLHTVIEVASLFIDDRAIVARTVSRGEVTLHRADSPRGLGELEGLPAVVLVDGGSASGSELLAMALRDQDRATVVGEATYGKNTGQRTEILRARDGTVLGGAHMTVFRWLSPDADSAAGGVEPDSELAMSGCVHPLAVSRQATAAAGVPGAVHADLALGGERFDAVKALGADGVLAGTDCGPGLFCPSEPIPRWMMAVWLVRMLDGGDPEPVSASRFIDVDPTQWWAAHVERLAELGVTVGCVREPAQFCPEQPVTRAQTATFLTRAFDLRRAAPAGFVDTSGSSHAASIDALAASGITKGCLTEPLSFCPMQSTTKGQMALFLNRASGVTG